MVNCILRGTLLTGSIHKTFHWHSKIVKFFSLQASHSYRPLKVFVDSHTAVSDRVKQHTEQKFYEILIDLLKKQPFFAY